VQIAMLSRRVRGASNSVACLFDRLFVSTLYCNSHFDGRGASE
jgi:hypothetical protein